MMKRLLFIIVLVLPPRAAAQEFAMYTAAGKSFTSWHGQADVQSISFELTRRRRKRVDIGFAVAPQIVWQPRSWFGYDYGNGNERVQAFGVSLIARYHLQPWRRLTPYAELAMGPLIAEDRVPASTSPFNVVTQPGFGITTGAFRVGYRFSHISNGGMEARNPGWNVSSVVVGVVMRRKR